MLELVLTVLDLEAFACDSGYSRIALRDWFPNLQSLTNSIGTLEHIRRIVREFSALHPSMTSQKRSSREGDVNGERIDMIECPPCTCCQRIDPSAQSMAHSSTAYDDNGPRPDGTFTSHSLRLQFSDVSEFTANPARTNALWA